jgi:DNA-binding NtrC family response regulator
MSRIRIIFVHPHPDALAILRSMLQSPKFEIIEATGDHTVLRMLEKPPGLVLLGVDLDEPDALKLLASIRREHPMTPVILLFATWHPGHFGQALRMGASAVLKFPLPAGLLRAAVAEALEGPEREIIADALEAFGGNRRETAKALGISRTTLYKKMRKYGLLDEEC